MMYSKYLYQLFSSSQILQGKVLAEARAIMTSIPYKIDVTIDSQILGVLTKVLQTLDILVLFS